MKTAQGGEPRRWKDAPSTVTGTEAELAVVTRLLHDAPPPDEVRLAHLAREVARRHGRETHDERRTERGVLGGPRFSAWRRTASLVVVSLLVGGVATAVTGNIIRRLNNVETKEVSVRDRPAGRSVPRRGGRRWRVDVGGPTQLELSVGPSGPELSVVTGQAAVTGTDVPGVLDLDPGASWQPPAAPAAAPSGSPAGPVPSASPPSRPSQPGGAPTTVRRPPVPRPPSERRERAPAARLPVRIALASPASRTAQESAATPQADPAASTEAKAPLATGPAVTDRGARIPAPMAATQPPPLPETPLTTGRSWVAPAIKLRPPPPDPRPVTSEPALLARALGRLRRDHDPLWALEDLDQHARNYPAGNLRREAALARAEALLALDRNVEALGVLDRISFEPTAADRRARLARGELRAQEGQQAQAIADFDRVLADGPADDLTARALYGRALSRLRGGDLGGAGIDLRAYLEKFPKGSHHADVEKLLRRLGG